jgi:DNA primase
VLVEGPLDALAVEHATAGAMAGVAPLGTTLTTTQAGQLGAVLGAGSNRVVVALDADPAGQQAAARAYTGLTAHGLDPRAAVLPTGLDPAATAETHGPAALVDRLALAQPMGRQLVDQALAGRELRWAEDRVTAARSAAGIIIQAPTASWEREIAAVADSTGLDESLLRMAVVDALDPTPSRWVDSAPGTGATTSTADSTCHPPRPTSPRSALPRLPRSTGRSSRRPAPPAGRPRPRSPEVAPVADRVSRRPRAQSSQSRPLSSRASRCDPVRRIRALIGPMTTSSVRVTRVSIVSRHGDRGP